MKATIHLILLKLLTFVSEADYNYYWLFIDCLQYTPHGTANN